jgi:cell division septum initiation protein DivIVA
MHGFASITFGLFINIDSYVLSKDVEEIETRQFAMPVNVTAAEMGRLRPAMKVFVNTQGRRFIKQKSYGELLHENEDLNKKIEQLQKKLKEIELFNWPE